jgi:RimJ/RimL family protein N-acetyltransferase
MLLGKRICLGPMLQADAPQIFNWRNTIGLAHMNGEYRPTDQMMFDGWLATIGSDPTKVLFTIRKQGNLALIGFIQLTGINPVSRVAELGILIGDEENRSQGYGAEAIEMMIHFAWRDLNLQRLFLRVVGDNSRAIHVYGKVGFEREGVQRRAAYVDGQFVDVTMMGLLR